MNRKTQAPDGWEIVTLKDVLVLDQPGTWGNEPTSRNPGVRVLRAADLTRDGRIELGNVVWRQLCERDLERRIMKNGDLILERSGGGPGAPVGRVALIDGYGPIYCSNFCQQLRVDSARCSPRYVARALWHRYSCGVTSRLEHQTTGIRNLDYAGYLAYPILLPPLSQQCAIAAVLDSIDEAIERTEAVIAATERLRDSLLHELLTRGVPGWHSEWKEAPGIGTIPACWDVVRLGDYLSDGPTNGIYKPESEYGEGEWLIRIGDFIPGALTRSDGFERIRVTEVESQRYAVCKGDILINRVNSLSHLGKSVLIPQLGEPALFESNMMRLRMCPDVNPEFIMTVLLSRSSKRYFASRAKKAVQQASINQQDVRLLPLPLPDRGEQALIAEASTTLKKRITFDSSALLNLNTLKILTADALLTGRIRMPKDMVLKDG